MPSNDIAHVLIPFLAILALLVLPSVAFATSPSTGSGSFTAAATIDSSRAADGNVFVAGTITLTFTGTEDGTCPGVISGVFHPDGTVNFVGTCTFTGTVGGSGSGSAKFGFETSGTEIHFTGKVVGTDGTGGLAGLHLVHDFAGGFTSATSTAGTYTVQFHFDP